MPLFISYFRLLTWARKDEVLLQPNIFFVEILLWNTQETSLIIQQQSREKRSIQKIHNLVAICTILYIKIEITGKYVYL